MYGCMEQSMHFILKCFLPVNWVKGRQCFQSSASVSLSFQRGWDPMCYVTITHDALNLTVQEHHPHPSLPSLKQRDTGPPVVTSDGHTGDLFKPVHFSTSPLPPGLMSGGGHQRTYHWHVPTKLWEEILDPPLR